MTQIPVTIGRHQVQRQLGRGGMGTVFLAWDPKLERQLAVKLLKENDSDLRERFEREAIAAARLRHPHIVTIYDVGDHDGQPFIAMEYVTGQTLADAIRDREPLPMSRKLDLIRQVCDGLGFAHRTGIVHRDVKPANMMVDATGSLKILDFGIARIAESASMTQAGTMMGTLNYMSPEQVTGQTVDQRSDIFAVGAVLYELVSYQQAFPGTLSTGVLNRILNEPPRALADLCPGIDPELVRVVSRAIEKEAGRRYQDLQSMEKDVLAIRARLDSRGADGPVSPPVYAPAPTPRPGNREELMRRRQLQIDAHLARAAQALAGGDYEAVIAACDDVRLLDADEARAHELIDQAQTALNQRQAQAWLAEAQQGLQRGAFTAARQLIDRAATLAPNSTKVAELRQALDEAVRARDDARRRQQQRQTLLARAESSLDLGQFEDAVRAADEFLAEEPEHAGARLLRTQAADGLLVQSRQREAEAVHRRAREAVEQAEGRVRAGDQAGAIDLLARFEPPHEVVNRALTQMRADAARAAAKTSPPEAGQTVSVPALVDRAAPSDVAGETVLIGRTDEPQQADPAPATAVVERRTAEEARPQILRTPPPVSTERPKYLLPALAALGLLVIGGFAAYWFSREGTPASDSGTVTRNAGPPPVSSPAPPAVPPPATPDPAPMPPPASPGPDEWRRAESAAAEARRAADAAGQRAITTSSYRDGRGQEQQAVALYRDGRVADAIVAAGRAAASYARATREASAGPREPVRVGAGVPEPRLIKNVDPVYPAAALAARVSGSVRVEAVIDPSGRVTATSIVRSIQPLDQAALEAVRQWEFAPTVVAGAPVAVLHTVEVAFALPPAPEPISRPAPEPTVAPPTTLPAAPPPVDESAAVRATIRRLAQAYSELNVKAILAIYPTADQAALTRMARDMETQSVEVTGEQVSVSGARATLTCTWVVVSRPRNSSQQRNSSRATFELEKKGGGWFVVARR